MYMQILLEVAGMISRNSPDVATLATGNFCALIQRHPCGDKHRLLLEAAANKHH